MRIQNKNPKGMVALISVVIICAAVLLIAVVISLLGLSELQGGYYFKQANVGVQASDSCVEEALFRLKENEAFSGGSFYVGDNLCDILITASGTDRIINTSSTVDNFVNKIQATGTIVASPDGKAVIVDLYEWVEQ